MGPYKVGVVAIFLAFVVLRGMAPGEVFFNMVIVIAYCK
jgi:hypothetical protein